MSDEVDVSNRNQYLSFFIGEEQYGVSVLRVKEVLYVPKITRVPRIPEFMKGVINLRGSVLPVIDIRQKLGLATKETSKESRIVIIEIDSTDSSVVPIGVLVDSVQEVIEISPEDIDTAPKMGVSINIEFIEGIARIADEFVIILNTNKVFSVDEINELSHHHQATLDGNKKTE